MASPRSPSNAGICSRSVVKLFFELDFMLKDKILVYIIQNAFKKTAPFRLSRNGAVMNYIILPSLMVEQVY
jgi:hypothetical protein